MDKYSDKYFKFLFEQNSTLTDEEVQSSLADSGINVTKSINLLDEQIELASRKSKLIQAKSKLEDKRQAINSTEVFMNNLKNKGVDAKSFLIQLMQNGQMPNDLTLAFRDGKELSDKEAEGMIEDLINLGIVTDDKQENHN